MLSIVRNRLVIQLILQIQIKKNLPKKKVTRSGVDNKPQKYYWVHGLLKPNSAKNWMSNLD